MSWLARARRILTGKRVQDVASFGQNMNWRLVTREMVGSFAVKQRQVVGDLPVE